ncbi:DUF6412 domain-containing protein [Micromonospora soli]|uniref:DUF6412 domain-containing protein n=1 Tax=Micromonospora sp. NBRC 110009 TaxID=3061627 RepID=UPI0026714AE2|nr:DUF6412 domain-containing protein [Micromonospora sp. NBRC 110009]WKU02213.1 DUF6412 domain-containing protein [Micromonospora sp. NBRC 110009]
MLVAVTSAWAYALAQLTVLADRPATLLAGAAVAAALLLAALLALRSRAVPGAPGAMRHATALRARARGRRVPRQADPDAAGRPRPRAPGVRPSAA